MALDVAILPPPDVTRRALELSAALPADESQGLRLDAEHLPHVTLTQQFVRAEDLDAALDALDPVLRSEAPLTLTATGGGRGGRSVWMAVEKTGALVRLHERLMEVLQRFERHRGGAGAFADADARVGDVAWVAGYRLKASFGAFAPHITLGHARQPPHIEPFRFEATVIAACHLGRFCTCQRVFRRWDLG